MHIVASTWENGKRYHYYVCKNRGCRFKVPADEIERLIPERIKQLACDPKTLSAIVVSTTERLRTEHPS